MAIAMEASPPNPRSRLIAGIPIPEEQARRTLAWGAGVLLMGIAAVGVGYADTGAGLVLIGLLLMILGIHVYGRLGAEGSEHTSEGESTAAKALAARTFGWASLWRGGLVFGAGLVVTFGSAASAEPGGRAVIAYGAMLVGAWHLYLGGRSLREAKRLAAKVEKRRRISKSPRP
jgi:hypothetical protein